MADKKTSKTNSENLKQDYTADDAQTSIVSSEDLKKDHAVENDQTSGVKSGGAGQSHTANDEHKLTFIHELVEIFVGSMALMVPVILYLLWVSRVAVCKFYGLPIFYSSLNVLRFLPAFLICIGIGGYLWFSDNFYFNYNFSVSIADDLNEKKEEQVNVKEKEKIAITYNIQRYIGALVIIISPFVLLEESGAILDGKLPPFSKNEFELFFVLICAIVELVAYFMLLYVRIRQRETLNQFVKIDGIHISRKLNKLRINVSFLQKIRLSAKLVIITSIAWFLITLSALIGYVSLLLSYGDRCYYLTYFDNTQYAIVLDTDDYYIVEPIKIIQHEGDRELIIHTDAYVYLDKAENPMLIQKETFDTVTILRE